MPWEEGEALTVAAAHMTLVHKLDVYVTMLQKAQGDSADVLQMVGWQLALFSNLAQTVKLPAIDTMISTFEGFHRGLCGSQDRQYGVSALALHLLDAFTATADVLKLDAAAELYAIKQAIPGSLPALPKAHLAYLLKLPEVKA